MGITLRILAAGALAALATQALAKRFPAPEFRLPAHGGETRELREYRGKIVVLSFWASWCGPCRAEVPILKNLQRDYAPRGVEVVSIAMDERGWPAVTPFVAAHRIGYTVLLGNASVARAYGGLKTLPYTCFLDRCGRIVAANDSLIGDGGMRKILDLLLAEGSGPPGLSSCEAGPSPHQPSGPRAPDHRH